MATRFTGGRERGRRIRSPRGKRVRPTPERVRAAIFSIIGETAVKGARVLDLYAGTGALGMEALSRGACLADFVESHPGLCQDIRESLRELGLADQGHVYRGTVEKVLGRLGEGYGLVFADPPYDEDPWGCLMERLGGGGLLNEGAIVVAEHRRGRLLAEAYGRLGRIADRRYGDTLVSIYEAGAADG